jgi:hypothetical protein
MNPSQHILIVGRGRSERELTMSSNIRIPVVFIVIVVVIHSRPRNGCEEAEKRDELQHKLEFEERERRTLSLNRRSMTTSRLSQVLQDLRFDLFEVFSSVEIVCIRLRNV